MLFALYLLKKILNTIKYYKVHIEARKRAKEKKESIEADSVVTQELAWSNQDFK